MGKHALEGLPGVRSVTSGWSGFHEANFVTYDPEQTDLNKLQEALRKAGTYVKMLESESG